MLHGADLHRALLSVEAQFFDSSNDLDLAVFVKRWSQLASSVAACISKGSLNSDTVRLVFLVASRIRIIAEKLLAFEQDAEEIEQDVFNKVRSIVTTSAPSEIQPCSSPQPLEQPSKPGAKRKRTTAEREADYFDTRALRDWFRSHLDYPFPTKQQKQELTKVWRTSRRTTIRGAPAPPFPLPPEVFKDLTSHQVSLWFKNARRRSGWTDFQREYAPDARNKKDSTQLARVLFQLGWEGREDLRASDLPPPKEPLSEPSKECRRLYLEMRTYLSCASSERVRPWVVFVVERHYQRIEMMKRGELECVKRIGWRKPLTLEQIQEEERLRVERRRAQKRKAKRRMKEKAEEEKVGKEMTMAWTERERESEKVPSKTKKRKFPADDDEIPVSLVRT